MKSRSFVRLASAVARTAERSGFLRLMENTLASRPGRLGILTYHRVVEAGARPEPAPGTWSATPAIFARQVEFVARNYRVISMEELLDAQRGGRALPSRSILLTFDDAYEDFEEHAWPILKRAGLPVTLFVPTGYPDHPERTFWWDRLFQAIAGTAAARIETPWGAMTWTTDADRLRAFRVIRESLKGMPHAAAMDVVGRICRELGDGHRAPRVLSWNSLRSLAKEGVSLGAHSRSHPLMDRIPVGQAREETEGSLEDLRRETGSTLPVFAYPGGHYNDEVARLMDECNLELAFTTDPGLNDIRRADRLRLRRIQVGAGTSLALLRAQLVGVPRPA